METKQLTTLLLLPFFCQSCIRQIDLSEETKKASEYSEYNQPGYLYPFEKEGKNYVAEITIQTNGYVDFSDIRAEIPKLKYNKKWLFMLTQDDCKQAAYSCTWAAINGRPLTKQYYYNAAHLKANDLPPDVYSLGKTLGSTDGASNEVRFAFTTTVAPEESWMNATSKINPGYKKDYYRFFQQGGLIWNNIIEMLNLGCSIAFHDVKTTDIKNSANIAEHFAICQDSIQKRLSGRGCKTLAEPNGNKTYIAAAMQYAPIQTLTAQTEATTLYPFQTNEDLHKLVINREINDSPDHFRNLIIDELQHSEKERKAIFVGVHGTDTKWVQLLLWLNDTYGKDGDDSVWFPSHEEYYEYNYYRIHGGTPRVEQIDDNTLKIIVTLPSEEYFYYPSITVNINGLQQQNIASIASNNTVTGLSYANHADGLMLNIDCRKHLVEHATHFVELYEKNKSNETNKDDARYIISQLKESKKKTELLSRIK